MIRLLDCTLRDGGYINNWMFGKDAVYDIKEKLVDSNIDIVELGFLKNEPENSDRTVFNSTKKLIPLIGKKKSGVLYAAMIDVQGRIPIDMIEPCTSETVDIIRVIVWKRLLEDDFAYCKKIVEKGYKLCVQPARVDQYSDDEFVSMVKKFETLNPLAIYVVDSWGTMNIAKMLHYFKLLDDNLKDGVSCGYHGHNNMQQAFGIAESLISYNAKHDLIIDSSIYGIGRAAGNLNTEIIAEYLNIKDSKNYNIENLIYLYDKYIKQIYNEFSWGYSIPLFITAMLNCNPEYGVFCEKKKMDELQIFNALKKLEGENKIRFNKPLIEELTKNL